MKKRDRLYIIDYRKSGGAAIYRSILPFNAEVRLFGMLLLLLDNLGVVVAPFRHLDTYGANRDNW